MAAVRTEGVPWWGADRRALTRVLADLLHAELRRLRLGAPGGPPPWRWDDATRLDEAGPATIDSLDRLSLSASVAELATGSGAGSAALAPGRFGALCDAVAAACRAHPPREVTFRSSGSTGPARSTAHPLPRLEREAAALAALVGPRRRRVLSAVPAHHAYGFIHSVLLPRHLAQPPDGGPAALPVVDLRGHAPSEMPGLLAPGDLVLGHPLFWEAVLRGGAALPDDVVGVTSTAPCPEATALGLRGAGLARLLQVYGASELAGIGWRDHPADPYSLLPGWVRSGDGLLRDGVPIVPPDVLRWDGNRFHVLGRRDGRVQVAGVNVAPEQVERTLARHPGVAEVAVRPMRPEEGSRLKAFVVPAEGVTLPPEELRAELLRFAAGVLEPAARPGAYTFGPYLPRTAMGKASDWAAED